VPTPRRANKIVAILRPLLSWAVDHGWRRDDPALRPGQLKTGPGYAAWSEGDVSAFLACPAIGEPLKRALVLGLYTGQRIGDCLALPRSARRGGGIEVVQAKADARLWVPEHGELTRWLNAAPASDAVTLLTRPDGRPWQLDHFNHAFAEAGASANEIMAVTGHQTVNEVTRYTAAADQRGRAKAALRKLGRRKSDRP
jgi:integrase